MTDNHNYDEPKTGSTDGWGTKLNTNFQDLDTDVEIRDTDANKGNYTPKDGAFYRATDTGAIYKGNGSSWVLADIDTDAVSANSVETADGTIGGDQILGGPSTGQDTAVTLGGGWTVLDSSNPVILELSVAPETDGTNSANIQLRVDESGGTTADYTYFINAEPGLGSGSEARKNISVYVPPGGAVELANLADPNGGNRLLTDRKVVL